MLLTPTYHVMEMYNVHQDATMLPISLQTADYQFGKEKLPAVSASASKDKNGLVHVSLTNIDASKGQEVTVNLRGANFNKVSGRVLASGKIQDHNTFDQPEKVKPSPFTGVVLKNGVLTVKMPAASVVVLELN
jgi:alpha-N-arabinofuranosidase